MIQYTSHLDKSLTSRHSIRPDDPAKAYKTMPYASIQNPVIKHAIIDPTPSHMTVFIGSD